MSRAAKAAFKDHFSRLAAAYASFRPHYPRALFEFLAGCCPRRELAWDCACGSGQATIDLAQHFNAVLATDASAAQIAAALARANVRYRVADATASGLPSDSTDLVSVAQALHWFDLEPFYAEARRVLRSGGVLAAWSYGVLHVAGEEIERCVQHFYWDTVGAYWPPERRLVEEGYRSLPFAFAEMTAPSFEMQEDWSLPQLIGYVRSWSASARYLEKNAVDPAAVLEAQLAAVWGNADELRRVRWPLSLRMGLKP